MYIFTHLKILPCFAGLQDFGMVGSRSRGHQIITDQYNMSADQVQGNSRLSQAQNSKFQDPMVWNKISHKGDNTRIGILTLQFSLISRYLPKYVFIKYSRTSRFFHTRVNPSLTNNYLSKGNSLVMEILALNFQSCKSLN